MPLPGHPFETDLDITGERSLHRLIDCAVTKEGSDTLRSWLLRVRPDPQIIEHRQMLVRELKDHVLFRDKLQLLSAVASLGIGPSRQRGTTNLWNSRILVDWIERGGHKDSLRPTVVFLAILSALNITCILLASFHVIRRFGPSCLSFT